MVISYVYGQDEIVAQFVASLIPASRGRNMARAAKSIGVVELDHAEASNARLIAGFVYHNWDPIAETMEMSCAALPGKQWFTRETIRRIYEYPFQQVGCQMLYGRVAADNERLLRQLAALNCSMIRVPRMLGRDLDGVLCLLTVEDWAANKFNKRLKHHVEPSAVERDVLDVATKEAA